MTRTVVATPQDLFGGALPGRIHLLTGPPGSGKSSACLQFLRDGIVERQRAALLTLDRPGDLRTHASHMGIDLRACLRDGRLTLLRYRAQFAQRIAESASPRRMIADLEHLITLSDLQQMLTRDAPTRLVLDPVTPFVGGEPMSWSLPAVIDWLDRSGTTSLLTWNGDITKLDDRRLEPLLERAAVILRFRHLGGRRFEAKVVRARHEIAAAAPVKFEILAGRGIVVPTPETRKEPPVRAMEPRLETLRPIPIAELRARTEAGANQ